MCDNFRLSAPATIVREPVEDTISWHPHASTSSSPYPPYRQANAQAGPSTSAPHPKAKSPKDEAGHVPRALNAFMVFRSEFSRVNPAVARMGGAELSKLAGAAWRQLTEAERRPFKVIAADAKHKHKLAYPDYKYSPVRQSALSTTPKGKGTKAGARKVKASPASTSRARLRALAPAVDAAEAWTTPSFSASPGPYAPEYVPSCAAAHLATPGLEQLDWDAPSWPATSFPVTPQMAPSSSSSPSPYPSPSSTLPEWCTPEYTPSPAPALLAVPGLDELDWDSSSPGTSFPMTPQMSPEHLHPAPFSPSLGRVQEVSVLEFDPVREQIVIVQQPYFAKEQYLPTTLGGYDDAFKFDIGFIPSAGYGSFHTAPTMSMFHSEASWCSPNFAYPTTGAHQVEVDGYVYGQGSVQPYAEDGAFVYGDYIRDPD